MGSIGLLPARTTRRSLYRNPPLVCPQQIRLFSQILCPKPSHGLPGTVEQPGDDQAMSTTQVDNRDHMLFRSQERVTLARSAGTSATRSRAVLESLRECERLNRELVLARQV